MRAATALFGLSVCLLPAVVGRAQPGEPAAAGPEPVATAPAATSANRPSKASPAPSSVPAGHPPVAAPDRARPAARPGENAQMARAMAPPSLSEERPDPELTAGTIRVSVVSEEGEPVAGAAVDVGVMGSGGARSRHNAETDASGHAWFRALPTGSAQAYRVNVPYAGATYGSTPFRLPDNHGYRVTIRRLPVTRDDARVLQVLGQTVVELRDERLHVVQQSRLSNFGSSTFVFGAGGLDVPLPPGATAFQFQRVMTDQRVDAEGDGMRIRGSLPPGTVNLAWSFDVPVTASSMVLPVRIPFRTFGYRVISQAEDPTRSTAPPALVSWVHRMVSGGGDELRLAVDEMPAPTKVENRGQMLWVTQARRSPSDEPLSELTLRITGIPRPGPLRWFAVTGFLGAVVLGIWLSLRRRPTARLDARSAIEARKRGLIAEADALAEALGEDEIGPETYRRRRDELVRELAGVLWAAQGASKPRSSGRAA